MQFSDLKTQFISLADDPSITDAQAGIWINTNYKLALRERSWPFMQGTTSWTVTSGTAETAFSSMTPSTTDFARILRATKSGIDMKIVRYEDRNLQGLANCLYLTPDAAKIGVIPTPTNSTDSYVLDYEITLPDMTNSTDVPVPVSSSNLTASRIPVDFHWLFIWKALVMYSFQQRETSDEFKAQYQEILGKMLNFYSLPSVLSTANLQRGNRQLFRDTSSPLVP